MVLYVFGIDAYLYGLILTTILGVSLNIIFASHEIELRFVTLVKPIVLQAGIAVTAVVTTAYLANLMSWQAFPMLILKGLIFSIFYILINVVLESNLYHYFKELAAPIIKKRLGVDV